jgi:hypothetical protein
VGWDASHQVLHGTLWVVVGGPHGPEDFCTVKAHLHDAINSLLQL